MSSFGPLLLGKVLSLNDTQTSVLTMVFKYCDDSQLPLLDLPDLRAVLQYLSLRRGQAGAGAVRRDVRRHGGRAAAEDGRAGVAGRRRSSSASRSSTSRTCCTLTSDGRGVVTCLELADVQDKPLLWSTFMMWMLAELYHNLPEAGDLPKPKLAFFFDEAHLLFADASKAFLDQVQQVVRLIRSKGVGVYFVTQTPKDVPDDVLAQLSNRVQHALRAHTPDDDTALRATVRTFPKTDVLRPGGDAHLARHRRGGGDRARRARRADAGGRHPADPAGVAHGAAHARRAAGRHPPVGPARRVRPGGGPRERARDAGRAHGQDPGAGARRPAPPPRRPPSRRASGRAGKTDGPGRRAARWSARSSSTIGRTVGREIVRGVFGLLGAKPPRSAPAGAPGGSPVRSAGGRAPDRPAAARRLHRRGAARRLSHPEPEERLEGFAMLGANEAADFFLALSTHDQADLLQELGPERSRPWMRAARARRRGRRGAGAAGARARAGFLALLDPATLGEVTALLAYAEDAAGGVMNPRYMRLRPDMSVDVAIRYLRRQAIRGIEVIDYAYVLDPDLRAARRGVVPRAVRGPAREAGAATSCTPTSSP